MRCWAGKTRTRFCERLERSGLFLRISTRNLAVQISHVISSILADQLNIHSADVAVTVHGRAARLAHEEWPFRRLGASCPGVRKLHAGR